MPTRAHGQRQRQPRTASAPVRLTGLSSTYATFSLLVARGTGLSPRVVGAWCLAEGGPADNPLNIGPGRHYGSTSAAAAATIALLHSSLYSGVLASAGSGDAAQISAIAASPWCPNCAGYAELIQGTYARVGVSGDTSQLATLNTPIPSPTDPLGILGPSIPDVAQGVGNAVSDAASAIPDAIATVGRVLEGIARFFIGLGELILTPEGWLRVGKILFGGALLIFGFNVLIRETTGVSVGSAARRVTVGGWISSAGRGVFGAAGGAASA